MKIYTYLGQDYNESGLSFTMLTLTAHRVGAGDAAQALHYAHIASRKVVYDV